MSTRTSPDPRNAAAVVLAAAFVVLVAVACNKGPAEVALRLADQAIAAAQPELETYAPGELAALLAAARQARARLDEGHYTEALKTAQGLPAKVRAALAAAGAEKEKRVATWKELAERVPVLIQTIATRVAWLVEQQRLPRGLDEARFAAARTDLESVRRAWSEAAAAFQGGDVSRALRTGQDVEAKGEALAAMLGLAPPAPPAPDEPTPAPTPAVPAP